MKDHSKYCLVNVLFEIPELSGFSIAEIYREYKSNRICKNNVIKPYVFSDFFMKEHTPIITYESSDYLPKFSNWSIYDKLQIQDNYIKYTYCEMFSDKILLITGSLLFGAIYSILIMLNRVLKTINKEQKTSLNLIIKTNEKAKLRMQKRLMDITDVFTENYYLEKDKEHKIDYCFTDIENNEINKFTNRFLELFTSENPRSKIPFLSATVDETKKYYTQLLTYDHYLVIDN